MTRELRLHGRGLTDFPRAVFDAAETLEVLDLSNNALTSLPEDLHKLKALRALFCSGNRFTRLPPGLGQCAALSQIGFRGCGLREIPAEALPPSLRWLTLTDNAIETLPEALGERPLLQKLMLAGNRLRHLPESLASASRLELLRLAANRFEALPSWLIRLPRLAWLAFAGNPLNQGTASVAAETANWFDIELGALLGEGASGRIHHALWRAKPGAAIPVALKLFKSAVTSDGLPASEMNACLAAGTHEHLIGGVGRLHGHPDRSEGLVMPLVPAHWRVLAGPPSLESCSRDVYAPDLRLDRDVALRIARGIGAATAHLHARGLMHGDLYGHNVLWDGGGGAAMLSDFGAASFLPAGDAGALARLEVLAWGLLLGELLDRCDSPQEPAPRRLQQACVQADVGARPAMAEALRALDALL